jgi:predicted membrane protein (TIGR00267 family)
MLRKVSEFKNKAKVYSDITGLRSISRRYFVIGAFDGVLTILGMIIGAYLSGRANNEIIFAAGIATAIALAISSGWGAFEVEVSENIAIMARKRKVMLISMKNSITHKAHNFAIYITSLIHALAPMITALPLLIPFVIGLDYIFAMQISLLIGFGMLFFIGYYLGKITERNVVIAGMRMVVAGVVTLSVIISLDYIMGY